MFVGKLREGTSTRSDFAILEVMGMPGSEVYRARARDGRYFALRFWRGDSDFSAQVVLQMVEAASGVRHPMIAAVEGGEQSPDGTVCIVSEYVPGRSLDAWIGESGLPHPAIAVDFVRRLALGLQSAHQRGLAHHALYPGNLVVLEPDTKPNARMVAKLLDLGVPRVTRSTPKFVAAHFMAPEALAAELENPERPVGIDARMNVYSCGCLLHYLCTGEPPFQSDTLEGLRALHTGGVQPAPSTLNPDVPASLERAIVQALEVDPSRRSSSTAAFAAALSYVESGWRSSGVRRKRPPPPPTPAIAKHIEDAPTVVTERVQPEQALGASARIAARVGLTPIVRPRPEAILAALPARPRRVTSPDFATAPPKPETPAPVREAPPRHRRITIAPPPPLPPPQPKPELPVTPERASYVPRRALTPEQIAERAERTMSATERSLRRTIPSQRTTLLPEPFKPMREVSAESVRLASAPETPVLDAVIRALANRAAPDAVPAGLPAAGGGELEVEAVRAEAEVGVEEAAAEAAPAAAEAVVEEAAEPAPAEVDAAVVESSAADAADDRPAAAVAVALHAAPADDTEAVARQVTAGAEAAPGGPELAEAEAMKGAAAGEPLPEPSPFADSWTTNVQWFRKPPMPKRQTTELGLPSIIVDRSLLPPSARASGRAERAVPMFVGPRRLRTPDRKWATVVTLRMHPLVAPPPAGLGTLPARPLIATMPVLSNEVRDSLSALDLPLRDGTVQPREDVVTPASKEAPARSSNERRWLLAAAMFAGLVVCFAFIGLRPSPRAAHLAPVPQQGAIRAAVPERTFAPPAAPVEVAPVSVEPAAPAVVAPDEARAATSDEARAERRRARAEREDTAGPAGPSRVEPRLRPATLVAASAPATVLVAEPAATAPSPRVFGLGDVWATPTSVTVVERIAPATRPYPPLGMLSTERIDVRGSVATSIVRRAIERLRPQLVDCYRRHPAPQRPRENTTAHVQLTIDEVGRVRNPRVRGASSPSLEDCLQQVTAKLVSGPPDTGTVKVSWDMRYAH